MTEGAPAKVSGLSVRAYLRTVLCVSHEVRGRKWQQHPLQDGYGGVRPVGELAKLVREELRPRA
jgi:hypothetical protein